jgi:hypothetical protein
MKKNFDAIFIKQELVVQVFSRSIWVSYLFSANGSVRSGERNWMQSAGKWAILALFLLGMAVQAGAQAGVCRRLTLTGQVNQGHEWRQAIGQGWVLRLVPLTSGYSGWDVVVDRLPAAGYPDAVLLATPPYGSINEREIGTSYGLRAQDAIGWNPRSFHFLMDTGVFQQAQQLYPLVVTGAGTSQARQATARLMELSAKSASGQLRIDDARLSPGVADPKPFAQAWALRAGRQTHSEVAASGGKSTAQGELAWMRFTITLWMPANWSAPAAIPATQGPCQ